MRLNTLLTTLIQQVQDKNSFLLQELEALIDIPGSETLDKNDLDLINKAVSNLQDTNCTLKNIIHNDDLTDQNSNDYDFNFIAN